MYLVAIFSSLICIQLIFTAPTETNDAGQIQPSVVLNDEHDDGPRSTSFLRFGRQLPASFLRFGRSRPEFLRFGRQASSNNFLRFGRKGEFLRFG